MMFEPLSGWRLNRSLVYAANLLISFHYFSVVYINSTFLSSFIDTKTITALYLLGSVLSVIVFLLFSDLIKTLGNYSLILLFIGLEALALIGLAVSLSAGMVILSFLLYLTISPIIYLNLDVFLETFTRSERGTGGIRGMFLSMQNITQVVAPLLIGYILVNNEYEKVYALAIGFLILASLLIGIGFRNFSDTTYTNRTLTSSFLYIVKHPLLNKVFIIQNLLRFFYAWMVIYTPLYLFENIGFAWSEIGTIFSIMLLPFLLLELPLGNMLDGRHIEKKVIFFGFLLMGLSVTVIPLITVKSLLIWAGVLFASRVGAACTEIASESYFFRHVDGSFVDTISLFRMARPITYIAASTTAAVTLLILPLQSSFFILALCMLIGLPCALLLKSD